MLAKSISGAAAAASPAYIEDVFSTYLYTGNGSTQTITNGIDLSGKGGLVWIKGRSGSTGHRLTDTARGATKSLESNSTAAEVTESTGLTAFNGTGFTIGADADYNASFPTTYASWTFREQAKFFDVVTYTGNGSNRTIAHNLGSVPGCIIVKRTDTAADWQVYHRSLANTEYLVLNTTAAKATGTTRWNSTTPTSTEFSLGTDTTVNANGGTYVAYLFAHDAGGFGLSGTDNVISCGYAAGGTTVNLGYEPQWVLTKDPNSVSNWLLVDNMRGMPADGGGAAKGLMANSTSDESDWSGYVQPTSTGFYNGVDAIYIAIRRGPMRVPTSGTSVFDAGVRNAGTTGASITTNPETASFMFVDLAMFADRGGVTKNFQFADKLRGFQRTVGPSADSLTTPTLSSSSTAAEATSGNALFINTQDDLVRFSTASTGAKIAYAFKRAPGFFDVVAYTGTGSAGATVTHNLTVAPELVIIKNRSQSTDWDVSHSFGVSTYSRIFLNLTNGNFATPTYGASGVPMFEKPTSTNIRLGSNAYVNSGSINYVAYLFASCPGVSKVGSYTGTGTTKQIDCGFTGGARFVLIKRTDSTGDWYVWDTARGIVSGNDPYLLLNSTAAEVTNTDYIDTYSAGFEISSTAPAAINANGGTFIFLAIA
jgi:hypothetical protein